MEKILDLIERYEEFTKDTIRLTANENLPDVEERLPFLSDLFARYTFDKDAPWKSLSYCLEDIETNTCDMLKELLECKFVNVRPISGLNGMITVLSAFNSTGDVIMTLDPKHGGHGETKEILERLNLKTVYLPFRQDSWQVDVEKLEEMIQSLKVNMIYLDLCMVLFPQPISEIKRVCGERAIIVYDASHVFGLIMGKQFQQPLKEGADIIISNTHKTFPGPHKAIFATNKRLYAKLFNQECRHFISQQHEADIACLGMVLEKGSTYFKTYAISIINNAKTLGHELYERGIRVQKPDLEFTQSHQLWIDCGTKEEVDKVVDLLNELKIVLNSTMIPSMDMKWGLRLGVQEVTKQEITKEGITVLAEIIAQVIKKQEIDEEIQSLKKTLIEDGFDKKINETLFERIVDLVHNNN